MLHTVERIGSFAGLASFLGLAVFALLLFAHGRDIRRLRDWAGSAPEREAERMEQTQTIAAQRAEELRELEEARTAEHQAIEQREIRRQRREEGLPEQTRGERIRERFSGFGETLSRPALLAVLFVVFVLVAGGVAYAVLNSGSDGANGGGGHHKGGGKNAAAATSVKPDEIEVAVLNGTEATGLAATWGDKLEGKGFEVGAITNTTSTFENSVVMFENGAAPEAKQVAKQLQIHKVQPMTAEVSGVSNGAKVSVVVGEDNAPAEG
ncbi:MAG TPA: LytR C-terminal domain-containing protein [Solirubrobacterales bacterium]|nr:LytR C-terminal domain-containing protein [Solirubrobacterales bacterium]